MIEERKLQHIKICAWEDVASSHNYWDDVIIRHRAIPNANLEDIETRVDFLGKTLDYPIIIDAMTGGHRIAKKINRNLAIAAEHFKIGMAVGSQRAAIENPELADTYSVISEYDIPLKIANLGAPQFALGYGTEEVKKAIDMIDAHAIEIHFNFLQEAIQPEGDTKITGLEKNLAEIAKKYILIAKETGAGISIDDAKKFKKMGFKALDVSGVSGTSFAAVEKYRGGGLNGELFRDWGIPAPICVMELRELGLPIIGSGGIRHGLDVARAIALGADVAGIARELLKPAMESSSQVIKKLEEIIQALKIAVFMSGCSSVSELKNVDHIITGKLRDWIWKQ